jgi:hypothetical protein
MARMGWPGSDRRFLVRWAIRAHMKALKGIDDPKMRISFWTVCEKLN